jgi:DNA-binding response OmpR family regulator
MSKVLVMDDDTDLLLLLQMVLGKAGYEVKCFSEGISIVNNKYSTPDLFIIDKGMNVIDGIAICKFLKLKKETQCIPVLMISGEEYKEKALKAGADYFLNKPLNVSTLLRVIESLLPTKADGASRQQE